MFKDKILPYILSSTIHFLGQLWKLDGSTLMNKAGTWHSSEQWDFQPKNGSIIIENTSKNKVLGVNDKDKVMKEDRAEDEDKQLWVKGVDIEGFFILKSFESKQVLTAKTESKYRHVGFPYAMVKGSN